LVLTFAHEVSARSNVRTGTLVLFVALHAMAAA
jgi:hypothetical protein